MCEKCTVLTDEQKKRTIACCQKRQSLGDDFLNHIITGDESWVYKYDLELKSQSCEWRQEGESCPKKARCNHLNIKTAVIFFSISEGSCTTNMSPSVRQSTKSITWRFWTSYENVFVVCGWKCSKKALGSCIMTTLLPLLLTLFANFWAEMRLPYPPPSILTRFEALRRFLVSQGEKSSHGVLFGYCCWVSSFVYMRIGAHSGGLQRLFLEVVRALGYMYRSGRGVFWCLLLKGFTVFQKWQFLEPP